MSTIIGYLVSGMNTRGVKFRPSDWIERIASTFASFDERQRLQYLPNLTPRMHGGEWCLFVAHELATLNPAAFEYIMSFVNSNQLAVTTLEHGQMPAAELPLANCA